MYTAFYGLREKPFALSPDPRFLYLAASHREALAHLLYGIEQGEGFISITGEVGTGKTTLCRTLLERLEGHIELAFLFNPSKSALELLQSICAEFGLPAEGLGRRNLMSQLNKFLLEQKERGRRVLLIIDEAQTLSENTLEQVRLLSNLETSSEKLIQILLLGQPELDRKLDERGLRQLRQRISVRWKLEPLGAPETLAYVRHRIAVAAGEPKELFSESALREVHRRTGGIPRLVNQLCDRALLAGYAARAAQIGPGLIRAAAREIPDVRDPRDRDPGTPRALLPAWMKRPWMYFALTLALVGLALVAGLVAGRSDRSDPRRPPAVGAGGASASRVPANTANGASAADTSDTSDTADTARPLGRLIGYVDEDGYLLEEGPAAASAETTNISASIPGKTSDNTSASTPADASIDASAAPPNGLAELRATDDQLAQAGLNAAFLAGAAAQRARARTADGRPVLGRSAVAPGVFRKLLVDRDARDALAESEQAFLDLYDLSPAAPSAGPATAEALSRDLEARGLMATAFDGGSLDMLRRLDHPALIPVALDPAEALAASTAAARATNGAPAPTPATVVPEKNRRWLALTGFDGDRVWLAGLVANRVVSVAQSELAPHWLEAGILVWKNHESLATRVERGGAQASVRWLQTALAELRYFDGPATGLFDAQTADALRDFQSRNGLTEDGVVGPLTQIALYAQLDRYPVPRLSLGAVRPAPPPLGAMTFPRSDEPAASASPASGSSSVSSSSSRSVAVLGAASPLAALISSVTGAPTATSPSVSASTAASAPLLPASTASNASNASASTPPSATTPSRVTGPPAVSAPPPAAAQPFSPLHGDRG